MVQSGYQTDDFQKDPSAPLKKDTIGTISGATWTTEGDAFDPNANTLYFDGVDDFVKTGAFDSGLVSTISFWYKCSDTIVLFDNVIRQQATANADGYFIQLRDTNTWEFRCFRATANYKDITSILTTANDGKWHHIIVTINYNNPEIKMYIDLADQGTNTTIGTVANFTTANTNFYIGRSPGSTIAAMNIKDLRMWDRMLGANERAEVFKGNNIFNGLIGWWRLDEGSGTEVQNYAGRELYTTAEAEAKGFFNEEKRLTNKEYYQRIKDKFIRK